LPTFLFKEEQKEQQQPQAAAPCCCSSKLKLPDELPSVEETLKTLAAALKALEALCQENRNSRANLNIPIFWERGR